MLDLYMAAFLFACIPFIIALLILWFLMYLHICNESYEQDYSPEYYTDEDAKLARILEDMKRGPGGGEEKK